MSTTVDPTPNQLHPVIKLMMVLASVGVLLAIAIPNYVKARMHRSLNMCVDKNLWDIDDATQRWAEKFRKAPGSIPSEADLLPFLPDRKMPVCPGGGTYILCPVGTRSFCSMSNDHQWSSVRFQYP